MSFLRCQPSLKEMEQSSLLKQALQYLEEAAEQGFIPALITLFEIKRTLLKISLKSDATSKEKWDDAEIFKSQINTLGERILKPLSEQDEQEHNCSAQELKQIARCYALGLGSDFDHSKARYFFEEAFAAGAIEAFDELANFLCDLPDKERKSLVSVSNIEEYYTKTAEAGFVQSYFTLGYNFVDVRFLEKCHQSHIPHVHVWRW